MLGNRRQHDGFRDWFPHNDLAFHHNRCRRRLFTHIGNDFGWRGIEGRAKCCTGNAANGCADRAADNGAGNGAAGGTRCRAVLSGGGGGKASCQKRGGGKNDLTLGCFLFLNIAAASIHKR